MISPIISFAVVDVERREAMRDVLQQLGEDAAEAERDDRPEEPVVDRADDDFEAARHLLHEHAVDARVGLVALAAARTSRARCFSPSRSVMLSRTTPASVLCGMSGDSIFTATGKGSGLASRLVDLRRRRRSTSSTTGMPYAFEQRFRAMLAERAARSARSSFCGATTRLRVRSRARVVTRACCSRVLVQRRQRVHRAARRHDDRNAVRFEVARRRRRCRRARSAS